MTHITDDMVQAAVMAYVRSGKQDADMMRAMRAALEAADKAVWRPEAMERLQAENAEMKRVLKIMTRYASLLPDNLQARLANELCGNKSHPHLPEEPTT